MNNVARKRSTHSFNTISYRKFVLFSHPRTAELEDSIQQLQRHLDQCQSFSAILDCAQQQRCGIPASLFQRFQQLYDFAEAEDDMKMSLASLRNAIVFLSRLRAYLIPSISLNDNGLLQMQWRVARDHALTIRFDADYQVSYVIFRPSRFMKRRIILNGGMYVLDFIEYLAELKVQVYKEGR